MLVGLGHSRGGDASHMNDVATPPRAAWLLLRGDDEKSARQAPRQFPHARVVLLTGILQDHTCWLRTALYLRDIYGHDVLLIDWWGHGLSPTPEVCGGVDRMCPAGFQDLVAERIAAIGWDVGERLSIAGASLGAAIAMRYATAHPERVARLALIAPAGMDEPFYMPANHVSLLKSCAPSESAHIRRTCSSLAAI